MAHEIEQYDNMVSGAGVVPWHGLGVVVEGNPTVWQAAELSGLTWGVDFAPVIYKDKELKGKRLVIRDDVDLPLGVVGDKWTPFQNRSMWEFLERFMDAAGPSVTIETCGSLKNGARTWALLNTGTMEYVSGDPIDKYYLLRNSFDGTTSLVMAFVNVRVVCANTERAALSGTKNCIAIRHTAGLEGYVEDAHRVLGARFEYEAKLAEAMGNLVRLPVAQPRAVLEDMFYLPEGAELSEQAARNREAKIAAILELCETGAGAEIPGVRGTAYGLYQAVVEYADHVKRGAKKKGEREAAEHRFATMLWDNSAATLEKQYALEYLLKKAA